jgi:hypothetical protein
MYNFHLIGALFDAQAKQFAPMRIVSENMRVADDDEKATGSSN